MQTVEMRNSVILSVQRALLGEVSPALRGVTVGWDENSIAILCYYDRKISPEDREAMSCVETEVMADFPDLQMDLDVIQCDVPQEMKLLDVWVYRRSETLAKLTNMPIFKHFKFSGTFKQANANDEFPVNIDNAVIYCYANGLVMLECNPITVREINKKKLLTRVKSIHINKLRLLGVAINNYHKKIITETNYCNLSSLKV
ncbi:scaffold protein involved in DNA repair [Argonema antarcticum]|uniref:scaffold protein involved in DNA repair n=1 Tax=Argonema antarcticum TaxID=2942763 RepID=UPI002012178F|nr:scaffold protein involved in DNA repair [Argonema antarcticum]MCL1471629.1 scaffold protein involved in DNA repair [Argonema antarcticum A004/B2]